MPTTLVATPSGNGFFIQGTFTSAQVIQTYLPAANPGCAVQTTDLGLLVSDGIRWNAVNPPCPPVAASLNYGQLKYMCLPVLADVLFTNARNGRLYAGWSSYSPTPPSSSFFILAPSNQLRMNYNGTTLLAMTTQNLVTNTAEKVSGYFPYIEAGRGFYTEAALTMSCATLTDMLNAFFLMPQQHNGLHLDSNPSFFANYEQWHEFDVYESGLGTNLSGAYRGAYLQWSGKSSNAVTLSGAPAQGATSISLASPWGGETGTAGAPWSITLSTGEAHNITLVNGSTGPYTISAVVNVGNTTSATTGYSRLIVSAMNDTSAFDPTVEHIYGLGYDPVAQQVSISVDGVLKATTTTNNANSDNTFRDSLNYFLFFQCNNRGSNTPSTMDIKYFSVWTP